MLLPLAPPPAPARADLADVAEQVLQEAALAAERRRLVVVGVDAADLLEPAASAAIDVAGRVEPDREHVCSVIFGVVNGFCAVVLET